MADPYSTLGVTRGAAADEIKSAYRKLAKKLHPDVNPGRKDIEQKFKEVTAAYDLLSDAAKRARYDRGEIDDMGNERGFSRDPYADMGARGGRTRGYSTGNMGEDPFATYGMDEIFAQFMGGAAGKQRSSGAGPRANQRGEDVTYVLKVPFIEATLGAKQRVTLISNRTIEVNVPAGTKTGDKLRLRGQGRAGTSESGDGIIEITVEPHEYFTRENDDIYLDVPISLNEAVLGGTITVPTLDGHVSVKIPRNATTGTSLRLKGKGAPKPAAPGKTADAGDMFVKLKVMLPEQPDSDLSDAIEKWAKKHAYDPRKKLKWD